MQEDESKKSNIRLTHTDMLKLDILKKRFGYNENTEIIRFLINIVMEDIVEKDQERITFAQNNKPLSPAMPHIPAIH